MEFIPAFERFLADSEIPDALPALLVALLDGRDADVSRTPDVLALMVACRLFWKGPWREIGGGGDRTGRKTLVALLFETGNRLHEELHDAVDVRMGGPLMVRTMLGAPSLLESARREAGEFASVAPGSPVSGIGAAFANIPGIVRLGGLERSVETAEYVTERPPRTCPRCGAHVTPTVIPGRFDGNHGFFFACPGCGFELGPGGKLKPDGKSGSIWGADGRRVKSTSHPHFKDGIGHCQLCGRTKAQIEALGGRLENHHSLPVSEGGRDDPSNLAALCSWCHKEAHRRREFLVQNGLLATMTDALLDTMYAGTR